VKHRQQLLLHLGLEVDEHVAAAHQIELREGRVARQVLDGKGDGLANALRNRVAGVVAREETARRIDSVERLHHVQRQSDRAT
jgi:hypothetical protein